MRGFDLTGQVFGEITVIKDSGKRDAKGCKKWECKCSCGNTLLITTSELRRTGARARKHCGSYAHQIKNLVGQSFGDLEVISMDKIENNKVYWLCKCHNCNRQDLVSVRGNDLHTGKTKSCGCHKSISYGAQHILDIIQNERYKTEISFDDCKSNKNYNLYFDFGIYNADNTIKYLIEYDGEQHFFYQNSENTWNTKEHFEEIKERDNIKNKYCLEHHIPLYRIPYFEIKNIKDIKDITQNKYLVQSFMD